MLDYRRQEKALSTVLLIIGAVWTVVAISADFLFGGGGGIGPRQISLAVFGILILLLGLIFRFHGDATGAASPPVSRVSLMALAAWLGVVSGIIEIAVLHINQLFRPFLHLSPDSIWMGPLVNLALFVAAAGLLLFLSRRWPGLGTTRAVCGVCAFLGFLGLLLIFSEIHQLASIALSAGLAVRGSALIAHNTAIHRLVRRTLAWVVTAVLITAAARTGWVKVGEWQALANLPPAPSGAPNVLLVVLDTVRAQNLSLYGYHRPTTPNLEKLAQRGVVFENAIATSSWTLPTHASLMTGRYHHEVSANWSTALDRTYPTISEVLGSHGYVSAGFVANYNYAGYEAGIARGFTHFVDYRITPGQAILSSSLGRAFSVSGTWRRILNYYDDIDRKTAEQVNQEFLQWLSRQDQRPFLVFLNFYDAHRPYIPREPFDVKFASKSTGWSQQSPSPSDVDARSVPVEQIQIARDAYDGTIAYIDHQLGRLFDELERRRVLENTLVIITGDHGEQFGEHQHLGHGNSLFMPVLRVPLLVLFPGRVPSNLRISKPVTLRDVPATIVDHIGLTGENRIPGSSLANYWQTESELASSPESPVLSELTLVGRENDGWFRSLLDDRYHYIRARGGAEELYDLQNDPEELKNLAKTAASDPIVDRFRSLLQTAIKRQ